MLKPFLMKLMKHENLSNIETELFLNAMIDSNNGNQIAACLALFHAKGETSDELLTLLKILKQKMLSIDVTQPVLDIVGTGGDGSNTFNISTAASFLAAAAGVKVIKHGNRSVSSHCGSADVLEALGLNCELAKQSISKTIENYNIAFCFAPLFHPLLKKFSDIRKKLEVPTFFNLLGPLLNPVSPEFLMLGVKNSEMIETYISIIKNIGVKRALIVHNHGLDEVSCIGINKIYEINDGVVDYFEIDPREYGLDLCSLSSLQVFSTEQAIEKFINSLTNANSPEAHTVILNAALALYVTNKCPSIKEAVLIAKETINSQCAIHLFHGYIRFCSGTSSININTKSSSNFLARIIEHKQQEIYSLKQKYNPKKSFKSVLKKSHLSVIAEIKRNSPAKGFLSSITDPVKQAEKYIAGGADAISILTDEQFFLGNKSEFLDITQYYKNQSICFLQKDFILEPVQIVEAFMLGANAVLLIASILQEKLGYFMQLAKSLNMDALVEIHSYDELQLALDAGADIIGINNRDLTTFETDWRYGLSLVDKIPNHIVKVSESAIDSVEKAHILRQAGFDAVLIGEALVKAENPDIFINKCRLS